MDFLIFLEQHRCAFLNVFFQSVTYLGQELFVVAVICWLYWCQNKKLAYTLGFSYFVSGLAAQGLKITFRVPRPWVLDPSFHPVSSAVGAATGYSFPSGHTQSGTTLFSTLGFFFGRKLLKTLCFLLVFLVGFSRMYLGCHTPRDVLVSMALALFVSWFFYRFFYEKDTFFLPDRILGVLLVVLSLLLAAYTVFLLSVGTLETVYAEDCIKAAGAGTGFALGFYWERTRIRFSLPGDMRGRIFRFLLGIAVTVLLQEGLKVVLGTTLISHYFRYLLVILWITCLYPALFTRFTPGKIGKKPGC